MYTPPAHYTQFELIRFVIKDLIVDIRYARRDKQPEYAEKCIGRLRKVWPERHTGKVDSYGWPKVLKGE